jgi:hypothetical protein
MLRRALSGILFLILAFNYFHFILPGRSYADINQDRSIIISTGVPSAVATHLFKFNEATTNNIGSIVFEYCSNSPIRFEPCTPPAGLNVSSANLTLQTGNTGFSIDNVDTTANTIVISRAVSPGVIGPSSYSFSNITNPSAPGESVFVRIWTHASTDGSGPQIDGGAVAFAVQNVFNVGAYVPPFLKLCVGITVAPDCSTLVGDSLDLGDLSFIKANAGQSQFATATNDPSGYVIYALGTTMTSGNNVIPALAAPTASFPGTGQFGINLRANLAPAIGQDPVGLGTGTPTANYDIPNRFVFNSGDSITTAGLPSNYNRMTVSYLVNIPKSQAAGIYSTTVTYVATVQF